MAFMFLKTDAVIALPCLEFSCLLQGLSPLPPCPQSRPRPCAFHDFAGLDFSFCHSWSSSFYGWMSASYSSEVWYLRLTPVLQALGFVPNPDPDTSDILMTSCLVPDGHFFSTGQNGW
eukprot:6397954-Ditylum_brightwellii.AAC.1